jgi:hypothetical protein
MDTVARAGMAVLVALKLIDLAMLCKLRKLRKLCGFAYSFGIC